MAETPAPALIGVQRVVLACSTDPSLSVAEVRSICAQLVAKAKRVTRLPVATATPADLDPVNLALQADQLLVRVALSAKPAGGDRRTLSMTFTPERPARKIRKLEVIKSEAQLARVDKGVIVQGPVDAFNRLFGSAPPGLRQPVRSDT